MAEDGRGLYCEGNILLDAGAVEKRAYEHLKAGTVSGLSIGFTLYPGGLEFDGERGVTLLKNIKLWDSSTGELRKTLIGHSSPVIAVTTTNSSRPKSREPGSCNQRSRQAVVELVEAGEL